MKCSLPWVKVPAKNVVVMMIFVMIIMSKSLLLKLMPKQNLSAPLGVKILQNLNAWYNLTQSDLTLSILLSILVTAFFGPILMRSSEDFVPDISVSRIMLPQPLDTSCDITLRNKLYWMPLSTVFASPSFLTKWSIGFLFQNHPT